MFKAIGRWGAQVKAGLSFQFISNVFGSKSKNYNNIGNDEEEIFIDANEDLVDEPDINDEPILTRTVEVGQDTVPDTTDAVVLTHNSNDTISKNDKTVEQSGSSGELSSTEELIASNNKIENVLTSHVDAVSENEQNAVSGDEHTCDTDDEHFHDDKKQIVKTTTTTATPQGNGAIQSAASSAMKKVHRRINSYSQRQYSKLDSNGDDENDNVIHVDKTADECDGRPDIDSQVFHSNKDVNHVSKEKKPKRRKKVPIFNFLRGLLRLTPRHNSQARMK